MKIHIFKSQLAWLFIIFTVGTLSSCGGGGGGGSSTPNISTTPNTTWTPQTVLVNGQTLASKFGEGNPTPVSLSPSMYQATTTEPGISYVVPATETALVALLSSNALKDLMLACQDKKIATESSLKYPDDFNINKWLTIDVVTGRKRIDKLSEFDDWMLYINQPEVEFKLTKLYKCFSNDESAARTAFKEVRRLLNAVGKTYFNQVK